MFAKLFERDGEQVLVLKAVGEDGAPQLKVIVEIGELQIESAFEFKGEDKIAEERRDRVFADMTEDRAFATRAEHEKQFFKFLAKGSN
ncbi:MAG: hypothetical protein IPK64_19995 [bacterium]|nr:hypothetical protein [bacterium]